MYAFGAGRARLIPAGGGQPVELGVIQNASLDLKVDLKELRGAYRYPLAVADGKGMANGTISFMEIWPQTLATILGGTQTVLTPQAAIDEQHTLPAMTPFTTTLANPTVLVAGSEIVQVTINNGTSTAEPVYYNRGASGSEAAATTANPTGGIYSIVNSTGVLTFAAGDAGNLVRVTYLYTPASNKNSQVSLLQVGMNTAMTFQLTLIGNGRNTFTNASQQFIIQMNSCLAPSLKFNFKLDDFTDQTIDYAAFIDAYGNLGSFFLIGADA